MLILCIWLLLSFMDTSRNMKVVKNLNISLTEMNNDVLSQYGKIWDGILVQIEKINGSVCLFEKDCYKIKVGSVKCDDGKDNIDLPLDKLVTFSAATISNRLLIEKDNKLFLESYLEGCLYEDIGLNINIKMVVKSLKIKSKSYYFWDDMVYLDDFDVKLVKVVRRESRIGVDIYSIGYVVNKPQYDINSINLLY